MPVCISLSSDWKSFRKLKTPVKCTGANQKWTALSVFLARTMASRALDPASAVTFLAFHPGTAGAVVDRRIGIMPGAAASVTLGAGDLLVSVAFDAHGFLCDRIPWRGRDDTSVVTGYRIRSFPVGTAVNETRNDFNADNSMVFRVSPANCDPHMACLLVNISFK